MTDTIKDAEKLSEAIEERIKFLDWAHQTASLQGDNGGNLWNNDLARERQILNHLLPRIVALESHNSSALKATLERIKSKLTDKEVGRYYHRQSMMGNRHKRMVDYALGLALEAVNFEIDSLLQQEGVKA